MEKTESVQAQVVSQQALYSDEQIESASLSFTNFITGMAEIGLRGNNSREWQSFNFTIDPHMPSGSKITNAIASVSLLGFSNTAEAVNLNFTFRDIRTTYNSTQVVVTGEVLIGDTRSFLGQLGYICVLAYSS